MPVRMPASVKNLRVIGLINRAWTLNRASPRSECPRE